MEPTNQYKPYKYTSIFFYLSLLGFFISFFMGQTCSGTNCDLGPELASLFFFVPAIIISGITLLSMFIRIKKQGLSMSKFQKITALIAILTPVWVPILTLFITFFMSQFLLRGF